MIDRLARSPNVATRSEQVLAAFEAYGIDPPGSTPEEYAVFVRAEIEKWAKVVQAIGLRE